ncbi:MarR family transcriptional regulator [Baekduia alba]|uniref:MarR family transcriptional regulator n=1 Tax=Baekduia alba TaxID=2997333 RepID=UPI00233FE6C3|nr:MarR family transcriptional regulator [Baekduia alba]
MRALSIQLSLLNHQVGARVDLRQVDLNCLDLIVREGPLSPTALARRAGLHAATITGILDRLERGGWVVRERSAQDGRAVVVRGLGRRNGDLVRLYGGMNTAVDEICASYTAAELELVAGFLARAATAGQTATAELTQPNGRAGA